MIDLYYWTTPNGHKITIFLEEAGVSYKLHPVNIGKGEQFTPAFLKIAPNNRIPAIVDTNPRDGGEPISVFESGAILLYLAEKTEKFIPTQLRKRVQTIEWLFWQMAGLGPMSGQNYHFSHAAQEKVHYAVDRYTKETNRLFGVLNQQLAGKDFIVGDYSIADMACFPWVKIYEKLSQDISQFPHLKKWLERINERPAVKRAYAIVDQFNSEAPLTDEARKILFGQTAQK